MHAANEATHFQITPELADDPFARFGASQLEQPLDQSGYVMLPGLLSKHTCMAVAGLYDHDAHFRNRVVMARHGFGQGEYKYLSYPLPAPIQQLREHGYARLVDTANRWNSLLGDATRFPPDHASFLTRCHDAGQRRPTPLLLRYGRGDFNCLHQDLYGEHVFPLQLAVLLSEPAVDFEGGEFVLVEQRPRMQSRAHVLPLRQGDGVIFAVHHRPVHGTRGYYRTVLRHGVSTLHAGRRHTLGVIFHDAS